MPKKYSDEFKKDALKYVEDHPELDKKICAEYLGVPYDTLYGWYKKARREKNKTDGDIESSGLTAISYMGLQRLHRYSEVWGKRYLREQSASI